MENFLVLKILLPRHLIICGVFLITPFFTKFLYRHKLGKQIRDSGSAPIMSALHVDKSGTPTMGGVLIWSTTLFLALLFYYFNIIGLINLNFLSRSETWLPLGVLVISAVVGLIDDWLNIKKLAHQVVGFAYVIAY